MEAKPPFIAIKKFFPMSNPGPILVANFLHNVLFLGRFVIVKRSTTSKTVNFCKIRATVFLLISQELPFSAAAKNGSPSKS